jgi:hypothetical protein
MCCHVPNDIIIGTGGICDAFGRLQPPQEFFARHGFLHQL